MNNTDRNYNKNAVAPEPPMGWNSYDYYNTMVNEAQVRANAEYMAANLKNYGWKYVVIDIQWSASLSVEVDCTKQPTRS